MKARIGGTISFVEKHPRVGALFNLPLIGIQGLILGIASAGSIWGLEKVLDSPWLYLAAAAISLTVKVGLAWLNVLFREPFTFDVAGQHFENSTGIPVPRGVRPRTEAESSTFTITVATTIALAIYLTTLEVDGNSQVDNWTALWLTALSGLFVAISENLCHRAIIIGLWRNRTEYQDSPSYRQLVEQPQVKEVSEQSNNRNIPRSKRKQRPKKRRRR